MKFSIIAGGLVGTAAAFPSMTELKVAVSKRQFSGSTELLGDLATLKDSELTTAGKDIKAILLGGGDGQSTADYKAPAYDSAECKKDECCVWHYVAEELYGLMHDSATGTCTDFARASIRMGFHDAAAWNKQSSWGGADGSLLLSNELSRPENAAMNPAGAKMKTIFAKYEPRGISMADLLQVGAKVGVLACPGGPRIRTFVGRPDDATPAPVGLLPPAFFTADQILDLFADKTVSPGGLVALIGAHTASRNHTAAPAAPAPPQDRTPGKWDTEYFDEHLRTNASAGVFRFPSDVSLARSPKTKPVFQQFSAQKGAWDEAYAREYIRMSLMGVKKINKLKECTRALPGKGAKPKPPVSSSSSSSSSAKPSPSTTTAPSSKPTASTVYQSSSIVTVVSCAPAPGVKCNGAGAGGDHPHSEPTAAPTGSTPASGAHGGNPVPTATSEPTRGAVVTGGSPRVSAGWVAAAMGAAVALL